MCYHLVCAIYFELHPPVPESPYQIFLSTREVVTIALPERKNYANDIGSVDNKCVSSRSRQIYLAAATPNLFSIWNAAGRPIKAEITLGLSDPRPRGTISDR